MVENGFSALPLQPSTVFDVPYRSHADSVHLESALSAPLPTDVKAYHECVRCRFEVLPNAAVNVVPMHVSALRYSTPVDRGHHQFA
jgi:hypothetical protein